jgi:hypothetical protein
MLVDQTVGLSKLKWLLTFVNFSVSKAWFGAVQKVKAENDLDWFQ